MYPNLILSSFHLPKNENKLKNFNWRKPGTGMIDYALNLQKYDKSKCSIIGDKLTDMEAGNNALVKTNILFNNDKINKYKKTCKFFEINCLTEAIKYL